MRTLINIMTGGGILLWSLVCWLVYGLGDTLEDWMGANASWIAGDAVIGSLIQTLLNAGQGLGLIFVLIIWAIGVALMLVPALILRRLFRRRERLAPVYADADPRSDMRYRPRHSAEHVGKGNMIGRMMDAAKKYR